LISLILTRHTETVGNRNQIILSPDEDSFTKKGLEYIEKLLGYVRGVRIDSIISSDFKRCSRIAVEISKMNNVPIEYSSLLREKNYGSWIGKRGSEIDWDILSGNYETRKPPNGENLIEVRQRGRVFFDEILNKYCNSRCLVISHSTFLKLFVGDLLGVSVYNSINRLEIDYCSITNVEIADKNRYKVRAINTKIL